MSSVVSVLFHKGAAVRVHRMVSKDDTLFKEISKMTSPIHTAHTFFGAAALCTTEEQERPHAFGRSVSTFDEVTQRLRQAEEGRVSAFAASNRGGERTVGNEAYCFERTGLLLAVKGPVVFFSDDEYRLVPVNFVAPMQGVECEANKTPSPVSTPRVGCRLPVDSITQMGPSARR